MRHSLRAPLLRSSIHSAYCGFQRETEMANSDAEYKDAFQPLMHNAALLAELQLKEAIRIVQAAGMSGTAEVVATVALAIATNFQTLKAQ